MRKKTARDLKRRRRNTLNRVRPNVTSVRSTRGRGVLLHLLLSLLLFLQTLLLLFREAQPRRRLELILGLLLRLMTILTPLLGLRIRRHTGIISVYLRVMMTNIIRILRIIRTKRLILCAFLDFGFWASVTPVTLQTINIQPTDYSRLDLIL